jgi:DNA replication and repair protein RecF
LNLESLYLTHFRNYAKAEIHFENSVNVIIGENAQGKTNVLEAIYMLAMAKSHRTTFDKELIHWDEDYAKIEGRIQKVRGGLPLELIVSRKGKKAKVNHLERKKLSQYIGTLNVVMFAPEDLYLVKGSPGVRRRFIDMEIGQVYPVYMHQMNQYHKLLGQRNALLKTLQRRRENKDMMLDILTGQLSELAARIVRKRYEFINLLQQRARPIHRSISRDLEMLGIRYKSSVEVSEKEELSKMTDEYEAAFAKLKEREIERGVTLVGPHRDDIGLSINEKDVQTYGSQGQQRTTALSLKLAEIELIKNETDEYPILLLDDVLSELDDYRQSHLLGTIQGKVQTFVTTTSVDGIDHDTLREAATYRVSEGNIEKER